MSWREAAAEHARAEHPREACGLLVLLDGAEQAYWPCRNVADDPLASFAAHPEDTSAAEDCGAEVMAVVHSHPDEDWPRPTAEDLDACDRMGQPWHVLGWPSGRWVTITPRAQVPDLLGRVFEHGVTDCYSIIRDWYRLQWSTVLPDFPRADGWWKSGGDLYRENFAAAGFREVPLADWFGSPLPGDVLLFRAGARVANHAGVYLGGDMMLHHMAGRLSAREALDGEWQSRLEMVLRYVG